MLVDKANGTVRFVFNSKTMVSSDGISFFVGTTILHGAFIGNNGIGKFVTGNTIKTAAVMSIRHLLPHRKSHRPANPWEWPINAHHICKTLVQNAQRGNGHAGSVCGHRLSSSDRKPIRLTSTVGQNVTIRVQYARTGKYHLPIFLMTA